MYGIGSWLGTFIYVSLLITNAMAVLSEDRFLARIGWASSSAPANQTNQGFNQPYDNSGFSGDPGEVSIKARIIDLISAVRTLMRIPLIAFNVVVIVYEVLLG